MRYHALAPNSLHVIECDWLMRIRNGEMVAVLDTSVCPRCHYLEGERQMRMGRGGSHFD